MTNKKRIATTISVPELFRLFPDEDTCYREPTREELGRRYRLKRLN